MTDERVEPAGWLSLPDVADRLGVPITKVHHMIRDRILLAERRDGILRIPAEMVAGPIVIRHLPGVLTLLFDSGYTTDEAMRWLYTNDDSLPGTPIAGLNTMRATEVKRRAQALGF